MKFLLSQIAIVFTTALAMCSSPGVSENSEIGEASDMELEYVANPAENTPSISISDRKIIRNGFIQFNTNGIAESEAFLKKEVAQLSGYVADESSTSYGERSEKRMTIRVPADQFDLLLEKIQSHALKVDNMNVSSEDVTSEYIDVNARMQTKKELESRYRELLQKSNNVQEILQVERELANVRGEIESMQGRLNYLSNQSKMSTLEVTFYIESPEDFGFMSKLGQGLKNGFKNLQWFVIFLVNLWPFILGLGVLLFFLIRKKKTPPPPMK
ncbi:DUF4349 domain-containing protein [Algoriphagus namhaensis]